MILLKIYVFLGKNLYDLIKSIEKTSLKYLLDFEMQMLISGGIEANLKRSNPEGYTHFRNPS